MVKVAASIINVINSAIEALSETLGLSRQQIVNALQRGDLIPHELVSEAQRNQQHLDEIEARLKGSPHD